MARVLVSKSWDDSELQGGMQETADVTCLFHYESAQLDNASQLLGQKQ
jgi:hypothetical protein